ncbi:MAG: acetaldehyde dehydrogenase (acetylating) [Proteobacteria bacterium]|nr:acetaldehyde dehydrogenase (acetylating) [Pseudomonadota bacterium]
MKIKTAILGTGNIGTDLLLKALKSDLIEVVAFVGRRMDSAGIKIAQSKGVLVSDQGIDFFKQNVKYCDVVYDCTNASDAMEHAIVFEQQGLKVVDLTPAKVGDMCVPDINGDIILKDDNVNMITCGGQASMPILHLLAKHCQGLQYVEVVSQIASQSAGMATRINVDNYIKTTRKAITKFTGCSNNKVILNLNPAEPCVDMQTTIFIKTDNIDFTNLTEEIAEKIEELRTYIPYYELVLPPAKDENGVVVVSIKVKGAGDYLPEYAGNLDIINCAAIKVTEKLAEQWSK